MQSKCSPLEPAFVPALRAEDRIPKRLRRRLLLLAACLASVSLHASQNAFAGGINAQSGQGPLNTQSTNHKILLSENTGYDGASLPAPVKKKGQSNPGADDATDDAAPRKHHHKKQDVEVTTETMSSTDPAAGATLPLPKKVSKAGDGVKPNSANEKEARPGGDKRGGGRDQSGMFGKGPLDLTALSLSDDQKQKIAQMHADNGGKMRDLMRKRRDLSNQMRDLMFDPDVTEVQIRSKRDEVRVVQEKLEDLRLNDFLGIRSVLTVEQRQKLKEVKIANHPKDGDVPPGGPAPAKRADGEQKTESKRLADTPSK